MHLESTLCLLAVAGIISGGSSLCWLKGRTNAGLRRWAGGVFAAALAMLGAVAFLAVDFAPGILAAAGMCTGMLIVALLWDVPCTDEELTARLARSAGILDEMPDLVRFEPVAEPAPATLPMPAYEGRPMRNRAA